MTLPCRGFAFADELSLVEVITERIYRQVQAVQIEATGAQHLY